MLDTNVNPFGNDSVSDLLIDDDTNGSVVNVKDTAGASMIIFVGHASMDGTIDNNVDDITDLVGGEGPRDVDRSLLFESFLELMPSSTPCSIAMSHL